MEGREGLPIDKSFPTSAIENVKYKFIFLLLGIICASKAKPSRK
jgi:hypothetical protein